MIHPSAFAAGMMVGHIKALVDQNMENGKMTKGYEDVEFTEEQLVMIPIEAWKVQQIVDALNFYRWSKTQFEIDPNAFIENKIRDIRDDFGRKAGNVYEMLVDHLKGLDETK